MPKGLSQSSSISDQILAVHNTQPKQPITGLPNAGPDSGVAPAGLPSVIKSGSTDGNNRCLSRYDIMNRLQYLSIDGPAVTGSGAYPYVLSDTVPNGRYRVVPYMSLLNSTKDTSSQQETFGLWLIPRGTKLPTLVNGADPFFLNYAGTIPNNNQGPPVAGIRVDSAGAWPLPSLPDGFEISMMPAGREFFVWPEATTLMGWGFGAVPAAGAALGLRLYYAELLLGEDFVNF